MASLFDDLATKVWDLDCRAYGAAVDMVLGGIIHPINFPKAMEISRRLEVAGEEFENKLSKLPVIGVARRSLPRARFSPHGVVLHLKLLLRHKDGKSFNISAFS